MARTSDPDEANGSNKSNFTDEFPLLNTPTFHINRRGQINRVEITKSRGNTRRWRVCEERSLSNLRGLY